MAEVKRIDLEDHTWSDERGWGVNPLAAAGTEGKPLANLHTASLNPGSVRGNHYHTGSTEWFLIFGGPVQMVWRDINEQEQHEIVISDDAPVLYEVPELVAHAVKNVSKDVVYLLSISDSPERDTIRCEPLLNPGIDS